MLDGIAAPISLLDLCAAQGHYHLALSHLILSSEKYRAFYLKMSQRGDLVGVDNSIVELGHAASVPKVVQAAELVGAHEFVLPDELHDGARTYELVQQGLDKLDGMGWMGKIKTIAVPHGKTATEWFRTYLALIDTDGVDVIGISMFDHELFQGGRPSLVKALNDLRLVSPTHQYHMLGCWEDIREPYLLSKYPWVRSMDTGMPVRLGIKGLLNPGVSYDDGGFGGDDWNQPMPTYEHRKEDFFAPHKMTVAIQWNIDLYLRGCGQLMDTKRSSWRS